MFCSSPRLQQEKNESVKNNSYEREEKKPTPTNCLLAHLSLIKCTSNIKKTSVKEAHVCINACIVGEEYSGVKLNTSMRERKEKKKKEKDSGRDLR